MKIAVAGDSAGEPLANTLADYLAARQDLRVTDLSSPGTGSVELYANLADRVCTRLLGGDFDRAILVCGTGIGVCISANKVPGIRAALTHDTYSAERAALSNNAQVITLGARVIGPELAKSIVTAWLRQQFDPDGRSAANVQAIDGLDSKYTIKD
ncbi:MAG: RpiB/LacA/LacB family sugar-phosphate isomerase [Granulosicoccus sp.]|nr:RpiB/LacA/LacB family sugar-phosphate isomerase [Granulosicoccus sp.]